jgi:soluble P-type ATPase
MIYKTNSGEIELDTVLLDLNGTLTEYGSYHPQVPELMNKLKESDYRIILLTWDQRNNSELFEHLWMEVVLAKSAEEKKQFALSLQSEKIVAIGNARIDIGMFDVAKLRIGTIQKEWIHVEILSHIDILVPNIIDAFALLLDKDVFAATMKA